MLPGTHLKDCVQAQEKWDKEKKQFEATFQDYCQTCGGRGGHSYRYDPSPRGVSLSPGYMEDWEPCPDCVENGVCPRCRTELKEYSDQWRCSRCEWTDNPHTVVGHELASGMPEQPECWCDYRKEYCDE